MEDAFSLTGLGLVLVGQLAQGKVAAGNLLVFESGARWRVRTSTPLQHPHPPEGVRVRVAAPVTSRQELRAGGIIGGTALIFAQ